MAFEISVPRLGWTMEEGTFVEWLKEEGQQVHEGDMLFALEGEKAVEEIESFDSGILRILPTGPQNGDEVLVGALLGYLVEANEKAPFEIEAASPAPQKAATAATSVRPAPSASIPVSSSPVSSRRAISPRAARIALELGVDWAQLQGSGRNGRIREQDVRAAASTTASPTTRVLPSNRIRKTIAARMAASTQITAPVTLTTAADATNLVLLRSQFQTSGSEPIPSYTDIVVKLTATCLGKHPLLNASFSGDNEIVLSEQIHIGVAVDTKAGLLVPVIRNVDTLTLEQLVAQSRDLIERARDARLSANELEGGTFTVTNLGAYGIDAFTPIINLPQCAILGLGRIQWQPVVDEGRVVPREIITLSLTFDHRIADGAPAARFLADVRSSIENKGNKTYGLFL